MTDTTELFSPVLSSASPSITFPSSRPEPPPYIRTSFSSGYVRSRSTSALGSLSSPIVSSPSSPSLRRYSQSRGHKHTKSLNAQPVPPPLPLPRSKTHAGYPTNREDPEDRADAVIRRWRLKHDQANSARILINNGVTFPTLPDNPRLWTPSQLAQYLLTALRFKGSKSSETITLPKPVVKDIANFVIKCKLNGRLFLRLETKDMEGLGVNKLWRAALLSSSSQLRKCLLKGRIWGFGPEGDDELIDIVPVNSPGRRQPSTVLEHDELAAQTSVPMSPAQSLLGVEDYDDQEDRSLSPSSSVLSFRSDASLMHENAPHVACLRSRTLSTSSIASSGVGRVREMVQNLEREQNALDVDFGSPSEMLGIAGSQVTYGNEANQVIDTAGDGVAVVPEHDVKRPSDNEDAPSRITLGSLVTRLTSSPVASQSSGTGESVLVATPPLLPSVNLPAALKTECSLIPSSDNPDQKAWMILDEEPTVATLLQEEQEVAGEHAGATSWGAKAWEVDFPEGTSRRVPTNAPITRTTAASLTKEASVQAKAIVLPQAIWSDLCRRLDETERRIATLERQETEEGGTGDSCQKGVEDHDESKPLPPRGLSPATLAPYLAIIGVGVCVLVAEVAVQRLVGRRSRP